MNEFNKIYENIKNLNGNFLFPEISPNNMNNFNMNLFNVSNIYSPNNIYMGDMNEFKKK